MIRIDDDQEAGLLLDEVSRDDRATNRPSALVVMGRAAWDQQFDPDRIARLSALAEVADPVWVSRLDDPALAERLAGVEVLLTGWGAPRLDAPELLRMPRLSAVLHCAGSVRGMVSGALWERGVAVSTSADLNAGPVAEFTFAAIVMAGKKAPFLAADARAHRGDRSRTGRWGPLGNVGLTVGLVGFSRIGRRVCELVGQLDGVACLVADPFADPAEVAAAGARSVALEEMLPQLDVLSIHAPELASTHHLVGGPQLAALPDHATVINTARGSLIDTAALERECATGRLNAILDVTAPEPLPASSVLYDLPNVMLTPHVAGSLGQETQRLSDAALDELERLATGRPLARQVHQIDQSISA